MIPDFVMTNDIYKYHVVPIYLKISIKLKNFE